MTDVTVTTEPPPVNSPEARTPTGELRDQSQPNTTPTESKTDPSFLNKEPAKPEPETKSAEPPKPEEKTEPKPEGAPEKYADFTLPEGFTADPKMLESAQALFKDLNLPQAAAQKAVDFWTKNLSEAITEARNAPYKLWADTQKQWSADIVDRFGGEAKAETVRTDINKAISVALPPSLARSFKSALDLTGAGTNPDIVEALNIFLEPFKEGKPVPGGGPSKESQTKPNSAPITVAEAMYGHLRK